MAGTSLASYERMGAMRTLWVVLTCLSLSACTISTAGRREVVVRAPPPAPRVEARPVAPAAGAVWVDGHWEYRDGNYYWVRGRYVMPRRGYVYREGHWAPRGGGYVWVEPRWEPAHPSRPTVVRPAPPPRAYRYDYDD